MDKQDLIISLLALIVICVIIFIIPHFNKDITFEKRILNNCFTKTLVVVFLLFAFNYFEMTMFILTITIIFFIYWILEAKESFEEEEIKEEKDNIEVVEDEKEQQLIQLQNDIDNKYKPFDDTFEGIDKNIFDQRDFMIFEKKDESYNKQPFDYIAETFQFDCNKL